MAYIDGENIYDFKGKHLGWLKRRVTYDRNGLRIGFTKIICLSPTQIELKKSAKKAKPERSARITAPPQPNFQLSKSENNLSDFLQGKR